MNGTRPPPCAVVALTSIDDHRALLYGGRDAEHMCRSSDLYIIDFDTVVCTVKPEIFEGSNLSAVNDRPSRVRMRPTKGQLAVN